MCLSFSMNSNQLSIFFTKKIPTNFHLTKNSMRDFCLVPYSGPAPRKLNTHSWALKYSYIGEVNYRISE